MRDIFKGEFIISPEEIAEKLINIKAFIFDWDGVFNSGVKDENGCSSFNEIDSMGTNLLRFNHYLRNHVCPKIVIITGENNKIAFDFAKREHFDAVYYSSKNKRKALEHFCKQYKLTPAEIAFVFDDVLDLNVSEIVGLRMMIGRDATPIFKNYVVDNNLADYITHNPGDKYAVREISELLISSTGMYNDTITHRKNNSNEYAAYLKLRNSPEVVLIGPEAL